MKSPALRRGGAARRHHRHPGPGFGRSEFFRFRRPGHFTVTVKGDANDYFGKGLSGASWPSGRRRGRPLRPKRTSSSATWPCMAPPPAGPSSADGPANASASATAAPSRGGRCRRSRLRVHDRRGCGGAGTHRPQFRRRHERRGRLCQDDAERGFRRWHCNREAVDLDPLTGEDEALLVGLIEQHVAHTGSRLGSGCWPIGQPGNPSSSKSCPRSTNKPWPGWPRKKEKG
jgi:hypothetical protein